jgi:hypothetical protein
MRNYDEMKITNLKKILVWRNWSCPWDKIWYDNMNYVLVIEESVHVFILIEIEVVMKMELVEMIL